MIVRTLTGTAALWAVFLCLALAGPAKAQRVPCGNDAALIADLEREWGEWQSAMALDAAGRMVRILVNPETGTWSMLMTSPGGQTCLISHGTAWEANTAPAESGHPS